MAALNKANGRANVAIEIGKEKEEVIAPGNSLPAGFVAPPRTIADITAILDSEKPDPATLAKLKKNADDEPDAKASKNLAQFYYDRATARVCWAGARRPWPTPRRHCPSRAAPIRRDVCLRIRQFLGIQKQVAGDLKSAFKIFQDISNGTNNVPGLGLGAQCQQGHHHDFTGDGRSGSGRGLYAPYPGVHYRSADQRTPQDGGRLTR